MVGIWDYPNLAEVENFITELSAQAAVNVLEQVTPVSAFADDITLARILVYDEWAEGTAEQSEDIIRTVLFFDFTGPNNRFEDTANAVVGEMERLIEENEVEIPQSLREGTVGIDFIPAGIDNFNDVLLDMAISDLEMVFNLTNLQAIDLKEGIPPDQYPRIPVEQLTESEESEDEVQEEAEVEDVEELQVPSYLRGEQPPPPPQELFIQEPEEEEGPEFPEINENLRQFAVSSDTLEIPAGKEEKQIDVREPYDFEIEMAEPGLKVSAAMFQRTMEEIAIPVGAGTLGSEEPVGTYPRTGVYIRNYLTFRGPAYPYEMYKSLVFYSGYISSLHNINVRAGTYSAFREYIYVLERISEEKGPELIRNLTQQEAAANELETVPDHPSIEGAKAPWLKNRQYYAIIEENADSDVWRNAYDYLHSDDQ